MAGSDHRFGYVVAASSALSDDTTISIAIDFMAGCRPRGFEYVVEREGGCLAAAVLCAAGIEAELAALWRVNAVEADPLAVNFDCIAVDDRGDADDGLGKSRSRYRTKVKTCREANMAHQQRPLSLIEQFSAVALTHTTRTVSVAADLAV